MKKIVKCRNLFKEACQCPLPSIEYPSIQFFWHDDDVNRGDAVGEVLFILNLSIELHAQVDIVNAENLLTDGVVVNLETVPGDSINQVRPMVWGLVLVAEHTSAVLIVTVEC